MQEFSSKNHYMRQTASNYISTDANVINLFYVNYNNVLRNTNTYTTIQL